MADDSPTGTDGALADGVASLVDTIRSEGWVHDRLAGVAFSAGVGTAAVSTDPFSPLPAAGLGWAMAYFEPLRELLDELTGKPDVVDSHTAAWNDMAAELAGIARDLNTSLTTDMPDWQGQDVEEYQSMLAHNVDALGGLGAVSTAMAVVTQGAGNLVAFTRDRVRDLIADLVARVIVWTAEATFVLTVPAMAERIAAAVAAWARRILAYTTALVTSLTNLAKLVSG